MPDLCDKKLIEERFVKSSATYNANASVQKRMAERLADLLASRTSCDFKTVFEPGAGTGFMTSELLSRIKPDIYIANDIGASFRQGLETIVSPSGAEFDFLAGDMEEVELPRSVDLVVSNASFQWLNGLESFLSKLSASMNKGGVLAFSSFAPGNCHEVASLTGSSLSYYPLRELAAVVEREFNVISVEHDQWVLAFDSPNEVLRHLKNTGTNALGRSSWTAGDLKRFNSDYRDRFSEGDGVRLTYNPLFILAEVS